MTIYLCYIVVCDAATKELRVAEVMAPWHGYWSNSKVCWMWRIPVLACVRVHREQLLGGTSSKH